MLFISFSFTALTMRWSVVVKIDFFNYRDKQHFGITFIKMVMEFTKRDMLHVLFLWVQNGFQINGYMNEDKNLGDPVDFWQTNKNTWHNVLFIVNKTFNSIHFSNHFILYRRRNHWILDLNHCFKDMLFDFWLLKYFIVICQN